MGGEQQNPPGTDQDSTATRLRADNYILRLLSVSLTNLLDVEPLLLSDGMGESLRLELSTEDRTYTVECSTYRTGSADDSTTVSQGQSSTEYCECDTPLTNQGHCVFCKKPTRKLVDTEYCKCRIRFGTYRSANGHALYCSNCHRPC